MNHTFKQREDHEPSSVGETVFIILLATGFVMSLYVIGQLGGWGIVGAFVIGLFIGFWMNE